MRTVLRQLWRLPAPADPRPASRYDVAFVVVVAVLAGLEATLWRPGLEGRWIGLVAFSVWLPTLVVRRTRPRLPVEVFAAINLLLVLAATTTGPALPDDLHTGVVALLIPYSLARWAGGRDAIIGLGLFFLVVAASLTDPAVPPADRIGAVAICLTATSVGAVVRARSMLRTHQLDDVRRAERERLARDLHDTVAHHLTAIAITAQAGLAVADRQPTAARDALKRIDEEATRTLAETRKVLHVLRTEAPEEVPGRPLDDLAGLAAPAGPGPAVEVALADDLDLSPTLAAAVHRIAREAVANARRHAVDATTVRVDVRRRLDLVELTVTDDGQDPRHPREGAGAGFGLVGMTERAELLGGRLSAGPAAGGGWRVSALLPAEPR